MAKKKKMLYDELPLYEIVVEDDDNTGIRFLSIVEKPAIEMVGLAFAGKKRYDLQPAEFESHFHTHPNCNCSFSDGVWQYEPTPDGIYPCDICKEMKNKYESWYSKKGSGASSMPGSKNFSVNKDQQVIAGPAMIPNKRIYRNDNGMEYNVTFSEATIKKIVQKFVRENNNKAINVEHSNQMVKAYIQEHWIVENSMYDKSKMYGFDLPVGTWFVSVKIEDSDFWNNDVQQLNKKGFSIEGILGQQLVHMSEDISMEDVIDTLTEEEIEWMFSTDKISFDYHGVLTTDKGKALAKQMIDNGNDVYIVTNADKASTAPLIEAVAKEIGIPNNNIEYANGDKISMLNKLGITKHYDNDPKIVDDVNKEGLTATLFK